MATNRTSPKKGKVVDIPTAPTIGTATAGAESATVTYTAATKGGPATTFTELSNPGSITGSGSSSPITVSGLNAGTAYTFTVRGGNATGSGEYSSASNSITALAVPGSYESISTVTVGSGGQSSITFSSIPSTYTHLQVRGIGRTARSGVHIDGLYLQFNGDTGTTYSSHAMYGNGSVVAAYSIINTNSPQSGAGLAGSTAGANVFGVSILDILDYANTNKYKTVRNLSGLDTNGNGEVDFGSAAWRSTAAITSIRFFTESGTAFQQYSQFALYGIKG